MTELQPRAAPSLNPPAFGSKSQSPSSSGICPIHECLNEVYDDTTDEEHKQDATTSITQVPGAGRPQSGRESTSASPQTNTGHLQKDQPHSLTSESQNRTHHVQDVLLCLLRPGQLHSTCHVL